MNILFPIAEATPIYKIGGLGDVGGALPKALNSLGIDVRLILPKHPEIIIEPTNSIPVSKFDITYKGAPLHITIIQTFLPGTSIPVYLVEEAIYLSEHTDASDNHADKFAVFSYAVSEWISNHSPYWQPHIIHCHDWHTALIPVILKHKLNRSDYKTIVTIHNLAYQGVTNSPILKHLDIKPEKCKILSWDSADGDLNILLEGLLHCDFITTVSPTYAKEILTQEYGEKIESILESRRGDIRGIINGVDVEYFNPATDPLIYKKFGPNDWQSGKAENLRELQRELDLPENPNAIMIAFVGRVDPYQKGIGIIIESLRSKQLPTANNQFVFLGTGDPELESRLHESAKNQPNVRIITRFDEPLAHKIYAAATINIIPSRFEPCGLVQLIAMRYGSLPVARATGGLRDTIQHQQNGFLFEEYASEAFLASLHQAIDSIQDKNVYTQMVASAINADYSWKTSAIAYESLYKELLIGKN